MLRARVLSGFVVVGAAVFGACGYSAALDPGVPGLGGFGGSEASSGSGEPTLEHLPPSLGGFDGTVEPPNTDKIKCLALPTKVFSMSADDSNSMGSPGYAREMLNAKLAPDPKLIRTYEFLNYYNTSYKPADPDTLRVVPQIKQVSPDLVQWYDLQIGVQAPPLPEVRRPMAITIVVDTSTSMAGAGIAHAKSAVEAIANSLLPGDSISLLALDTTAEPLLPWTIVGAADVEKQALKKAALELKIGGAADFQGGLVRGYAVANEHHTKDGINRLVLITDGRANPSAIDPEFVAENAKNGDAAGIYLVGVGTGPAQGYNDALLNMLTDYGRGAYVYIDSDAEAKSIFGERFQEVMDVAARGVSVNVTVPDYVRVQKYYGESIKSSPEGTMLVEPQHLGAGDSMVFHMIVTACASLVSAQGPDDKLTVSVDWTHPITLKPVHQDATYSFAELAAASVEPMLKTEAVIAYAEALKSLDSMRIGEAAVKIEETYSKTGMTDADLSNILLLIKNHPLYVPPPQMP